MGIKKEKLAAGFLCEFCCSPIETIKVVNNYYACEECFETKTRRQRLLEAEKEWDEESHVDTKIRK